MNNSDNVDNGLHIQYDDVHTNQSNTTFCYSLQICCRTHRFYSNVFKVLQTIGSGKAMGDRGIDVNFGDMGYVPPIILLGAMPQILGRVVTFLLTLDVGAVPCDALGVRF